MKYRHSFHAGNFADIHKHVTLLALIASLQRKDKGFLYLETHAGRGAYDLSESPGSRASRTGLTRLLAEPGESEEIQAYGKAVRHWRELAKDRNAYPGSPVVAAGALRAQDRAVLIEQQPAEAHALERALSHHGNVRVELGDGYEQLRAHLPPIERRGLVLIDPPYQLAPRMRIWLPQLVGMLDATRTGGCLVEE